MANVLTRTGITQGAGNDHSPGEPPPFHSSENNLEDVPGDFYMSRLTGQDVTPNPGGQTGYSAGRAGAGSGYLGRDLADNRTWAGRPYAPSSGMLSRLHQEGAFNAS